MSISIACSCGKKYRVKETLAGKKIRCADCAELIKVPLQVADDDAESDEFGPLEPAAHDQEESEPSLPPRVKRRSQTTKRDVTADDPARQKLLKKGVVREHQWRRTRRRPDDVDRRRLVCRGTRRRPDFLLSPDLADHRLHRRLQGTLQGRVTVMADSLSQNPHGKLR